MPVKLKSVGIRKILYSKSTLKSFPRVKIDIIKIKILLYFFVQNSFSV